MTPGPWVYSAGRIVAGRGYIIADIRQQEAETIPNARLIAAAPDMLAELQRLYERHGYQSTADVIAKATGEA